MQVLTNNTSHQVCVSYDLNQSSVTHVICKPIIRYSHDLQAFFLRILKVIIQLQQASKGQPITDFGNHSRVSNPFRWRSSLLLHIFCFCNLYFKTEHQISCFVYIMPSCTYLLIMTCFVLVSQFERDADALMDILVPRYRSGGSDRSNVSSSTPTVAASTTSETEQESEKGLQLLKFRFVRDTCATLVI